MAITLLIFLCLPYISLQQNIGREEIIFHYNNTYKYNVLYTVEVDKHTEYIMEFGGDPPTYADHGQGSPARVTVASDFANKTYPLFITARQQKGVFSWQLPMLVQTPVSLQQFTNISRTLCPHNNLFSEDEDTCDVSSVNTPIVHLTSSSPVSIKVTIKVEIVNGFYLKLNTTKNITSTPSQPMYYFYSFDQNNTKSIDLDKQSLKRKQMCNEELNDSEQTTLKSYYEEMITYKPSGWMSRPKSVIVMIESDNDICAVVSIQNFSFFPIIESVLNKLSESDKEYVIVGDININFCMPFTRDCPVFDNERDILYDGYYLTMTRRGGITLTQDTFPMGFYIVFIVKTSDEDCTDSASNGTITKAFFGWSKNQYISVGGEGRVKNFSFRIIETISYQEYIIAAGVALAFFLSFYVAFIISIFCERQKRREDSLIINNEEGSVVSSGTTSEVNGARRRRNNAMEGSGTSRQYLVGEGDGNAERDGSSSSDTESDISTVATEDVIDKDLYRSSGRLCVASLARCRPRVLQARSKMYLWNVLTVAVFYTLPVIQLVVTYQRMLNQSGNQDLCYFNFLCAHPLMVLSDFNHVYSNLGYVLLGFLFLCRVWRRHNEYLRKTIAEKELGIPQHFGLLYAMGVALVSEGALSAAYHVCPNSMNFQFDTSFMYVTSVLCMVKIYQCRHPDINARAHATFAVLALIIFIGLVGVLNANMTFWVLFTILHLTTCLVMTFQIYYLGRFRLDIGTVYRAGRELVTRPLAAITPTYCGRCVLLLIANLANWAIAAYGVSQHSRDFASHLLLVLMSNLFLYTLFYIVMKLLHRESIRWYSWVYIALTYSVWFGSSYFYLDQSTNWALTPAQSRQSNRVCSLLQLYDSHDIWHFLSSTAMFFSFNMYLTIDDNLSDVPRSNIMVF